MAYPTTVDSFTTHSAGQVIASADINAIQTAVVALETLLGTTAGGTKTVSTLLITDSAGSDAAGAAFKGCLWTPTSNVTVFGMACMTASAASGASYQGKVLALASNGVGATTVATVVGSTDVGVNGTNTSGGVLELPCSTPFTLTGGVTYALMMGSTTTAGGTSFAIGIQRSMANPLSTVLIPGSLGNQLTCTVAGGPVVSSAVTVSAIANTRTTVAVVGR